MKRTVLAIMFSVLLLSVIGFTFNVQPVEATGTIYIRADGSVDPPTVPVQRVGDIYTLTGNIYASVVIERDNIVVDGADYTLSGTGSGVGINLAGRSNLTIKNVNIMAFQYGVWLSDSSDNTIVGNNITASKGAGISMDYGIVEVGSSRNKIIDNNIANNDGGIGLHFLSDHNNISNNRITANNWDGISLFYSNHNILSDNNVAGNKRFGIWLSGVSNTTLRNNIMAKNKYNLFVDAWRFELYLNDIDVSNTVDGKPIYYWINKRDLTVPQDAGYVAFINCANITVKGLNLKSNGDGFLLAHTQNSTITQNNIAHNLNAFWLDLGNSNNVIYHNNFLNNTRLPPWLSGSNVWDAGYPKGGNYWSDYKGTDQYKGPYQNETVSDGIGDTPYIIDVSNIDRYPLMKPFTPLLGDLNNDFKVDIKDLAIAALAYGSYPGYPRWSPQADINEDGKVDIRDLVLIAKNFGKTWP